MRKNEKKGRNTGTDTAERNAVELFLEDVEAQIQYKPAAKRIGRELSAHLEDKAEVYIDEGMAENEALSRAVKDMGDAASLGVMLNQTHRVSFPWHYIAAVFLAVLIGIAGNFMCYARIFPLKGYEVLWTLEASIYFPFGLAVFVIMAKKGYPWIIQYNRLLLALTGVACVVMAVMTGIHIDGADLFYYLNMYYGYMLAMPAIILPIPALLVLAYKLRSRSAAAIGVPFCLFGISLLFFVRISGKSLNMSYKIISFAAFLIPMLYLAVRKCFRVSVKKAVLAVSLSGCLIGGLWTADNWTAIQKYAMQCFQPETVAESPWDDSYNSILIKELLPQAPLFGKIEISQEALENYYTAKWYFEGNGDSVLPMRSLEDNGKENDLLELTDILPQHYHNNYRIAYWILQYGWAPGMILTGGILLIYILMFILVLRLHNPLGKAMSLSASIYLLLQTIFYIAGNFGFQFGWFTTLPFISEGLVSITCNMLLAGLIASCCSYDHAVSEEEEMKSLRSLGKKVTASD
ncbi:permease prefix domain 1-containing protein [Eisenbergiella sp.]